MINLDNGRKKVHHSVFSYGRKSERYDNFYYSRSAIIFDDFIKECKTATILAAKSALRENITITSDFDLIELACKLLPDRGFIPMNPFEIYLALNLENEDDPYEAEFRIHYSDESDQEQEVPFYNFDYTYRYQDEPERVLLSFEGSTRELRKIIDEKTDPSLGLAEFLDVLFNNGCKPISYHECTFGCRHGGISPDYIDCLGDDLFEKIVQYRNECAAKRQR